MDINNLFLGTQGTPKIPFSILVKILGNIYAVAFLDIIESKISTTWKPL